MPDRVKSFGVVDSSEDRPRAWLGFVKPTRNGLIKEQNLIKSRSFSAEIGMAGRENGVRLQKESRHNRAMHSKSFEVQEVREIGRKEAGESRGFPT